MPADIIDQTSIWRLIDTGFNNGPINMAIDEAILQSIASGSCPPTVRIYGWNPTCLSLGFRQHWEIVDEVACQRQGWDIVRRPTGGRAILHHEELTYSVAAPVNEPLVRGGVLESYLRLSKALLAGLSLLGLQSGSSNQSTSDRKTTSPVCFDMPSDYEITVNGKKLLGSAQVRKYGVVLQHGSLPLRGKVDGIVEALSFSDLQTRDILRQHLNNSAITLEDALGSSVTYSQVNESLVSGFEETFRIVLEKDSLTSNERATVNQLLEQKYLDKQWTRRM